MPICKKCNSSFPNRKFIDGKEYTFYNRRYCLKCNPLFSKKFVGPECNYDVHGNKIKVKGIRTKFNCKTCGKEFYNKYAIHECGSCKSKKIRNLRKQEAIAYKGKKCYHCGYDKCYKALTFHHINPKDKSFDIAQNWEKSLERVKSELDKCILLCANCHAELHAGFWKLDTLENMN